MLKRYKPWKQISDRRLAGLAAKKVQKDKDHVFFQQIWEKRGGICEITKEPLGSEPLTTMFHHILPKAKFPQYRYCPWNIVMVQPLVHAQIESDMDRVPGIRQRNETLLQQHQDGKLNGCDPP